MSILNLFQGGRGSAPLARERLQILLSHERTAGKQPDLLAELRKQWEDWDRDMLPLPTSAVAPMSNLSAMLW